MSQIYIQVTQWCYGYLLWLSLRKIVSTCLLYGAAFHIWSSCVLLQLDDDDYDVDHLESSQGGNGVRPDNDKGHKNHAHRAETINGEDTLFIPLGWPRLRKGDFYASSDPEWQQFVKISKDSRKLELLRGENRYFLRDMYMLTISFRWIGGDRTAKCVPINSNFTYARKSSHFNGILAGTPFSISSSTCIWKIRVWIDRNLSRYPANVYTG